MCARYSLTASAEELIEWFKLRKQLRIVPRYNIAPTQPVLVLTAPHFSSHAKERICACGQIRLRAVRPILSTSWMKS